MSISVVYSKPAVVPPPTYNPSIPGDFLSAVQSSLKAKAIGAKYRHHHAKVAEAVLVEMLPMFSVEIRTVGSRKGFSFKIGKDVASQLGGSAAAALAALWSIRFARNAGIYGVFHAAAHKPGFGSTLVRILGQTEFNSLVYRIGWRGAVKP
jgi:hypothetical protein